MSLTLVKIIDDFQVELDLAQHPQVKSPSYTHALEHALSSFLLLEGAFLDSLVFDDMLRRQLRDALDMVEQEIGFLLWREHLDDTTQLRITSLLFRIDLYRHELDLKCLTQVNRSFRLPLVSRSDSFRGLEFNPDDDTYNRQCFIEWNKAKLELQKEVISIAAEYNHLKHNSEKNQNKSGKQPPPPPPPPIKSKLTKRRSEITRLPKVIRLFHSFQPRRSEGSINCARTSIKRVNSTVPADPSAVIEELMSKSKHARQINEEIQKYGEEIRSWAEEIRSTSFKNMSEMNDFVRDMDDKITQHLTDEISIFKKFNNWPVRYDMMREASGKYKQLKELELALLSWKVDGHPAELDEELKRMREFIDRVDFRLQDYLRLQSAEEMKYAKYELPWSSEIYEQVKRASFHVLEQYFKHVIQSIENGCFTLTRKRDLLSNCACFAFKIHQMVGGFNNICTEAFTQIESIAQTVIHKSTTISNISNPGTSRFKSGNENFTLIQPTPCNVANC